MRIGDIITVLSEPVVHEDKWLGTCYPAIVKTFRSKFEYRMPVTIFVRDNICVPQKHTFEKGIKTTINDVTENSTFTVLDIDIKGYAVKDSDNNRAEVRVFVEPYQRNFMNRYIEHAITQENDGFPRKNIDGEETISPFTLFKLIKHMYYSPNNPQRKEIKALECALGDVLKENAKLKKENERLEQLSLVAGGINIFTKTGKIKQKYLKDLKV